MAGPFFFSKAVGAALVALLLAATPLRADTLRLLADLEYSRGDTTTTTRATGAREETQRGLFAQLYRLDFSKEVTPTLLFNGGGLFDLETIDTDRDSMTTSEKTSQRNRSYKPYGEVQLTTPLLRGATGYRRGEIKESGASNLPWPSAMDPDPTARRFTEEYSARLNWKPVQLPTLDLNLSRNLAWDEPLSTDTVNDLFELRSRYTFKDFNFDYAHLANDLLQKTNDAETHTTSDSGAIRYQKAFFANKLGLSAGVRLKRDTAKFSGPADHLVVVSGSPFANIDETDPFSTPIPGTDFKDTLGDVNLLAAPPSPLSMGLDFDEATPLDTLYIHLVTPDSTNSQATVSEVEALDHLYTWSLYVSDNKENWQARPAPQVLFNAVDNRFELRFAGVKTHYVKIVTTPLNQNPLPGKEIRILDISAWETVDTDVFRRTNLNTDLAATWRMSEATSSGYDLHYRKETSQPDDRAKAYLNMGANLRHVWTPVFSGAARLARSEVREQGDITDVGYTWSMSLRGSYLDTFNQILTYSYNNDRDRQEGNSTANALLLRSNLDLYQGLSLTLDNGYSWQYPAGGGKTTTTYARLGSNITPNRWLSLTLTYGVSWSTQPDSPSSRDQTGSLVASWAPFPTLSLAADLSYTDKAGPQQDSTARQIYHVNWSPFRDGTLQFSLGYGASRTTLDEKTSSLSPALKWQINRNCLLSLEYSVGERENRTEIATFNNATVMMRLFY
jgi:hypothetical protein